MEKYWNAFILEQLLLLVDRSVAIFLCAGSRYSVAQETAGIPQGFLVGWLLYVFQFLSLLAHYLQRGV